MSNPQGNIEGAQIADTERVEGGKECGGLVAPHRLPYGRPCDVCGEAGPCGYDTEGRPMIHTEEEANPGG